MWTFSVFLESVAVLPQLWLLQNKGKSEAINSHYLFLLGGYRAMYLVNWAWRFVAEGYAPYNAWLAGLIQTVLYADFLYVYVKKYVSSRFGSFLLSNYLTQFC